jgi:purine nucleosidase
VAEYNIWVDPEAARIVFDSGAPIEMVGWDISRTFASFDPAEAQAIRAIGTKTAAFAVDIQHTLTEFAVGVSGLSGFDLPDPVAMAVALDPSIVTKASKLAVEIDIGWGPSRGQTIVDRRGITKRPPNATVVDEVSRAAFVSMVHRAVGSFP